MRIGITGHQQLDDPADWNWVSDTIRAELAKLSAPLIGVTSLALGADQLLAVLVLEKGGSIHAVLPYRDIERSFSPEDLPAYKRLVAQADVEVLSTPGSDADAYLAAGLRVANLSDVLFAVWNGRPAVGKGGTADVVCYAAERGIPLIHLNPVFRSVTRSGPSSAH